MPHIPRQDGPRDPIPHQPKMAAGRPEVPGPSPSAETPERKRERMIPMRRMMDFRMEPSRVFTALFGKKAEVNDITRELQPTTRK